MKEVVYDLDSFGIPVYISGDSLLVEDRINRMINQLDNMCSTFGLRPASHGREVVDHAYREWNMRADVLTHTAR
eukprot:39219-Pyramimonas_sp.AAC.1